MVIYSLGSCLLAFLSTQLNYQSTGTDARGAVQYRMITILPV